MDEERLARRAAGGQLPWAIESRVVSLMQELQGELREAMAEQAIDQAELARRLELPEEETERWLWDTTVPLESLARISHVLGVRLGGCRR